MRTHPFTLFATLAIYGAMPLACAAQERVQQPRLSEEQWRQDLGYFARELERRHKNLFHTVSREEFAGAVARLDSAIPSLEPHEIVVRITQIAALVGDGHTGVHLPPYFSLYPIALYWFGPELRVTAATREYQRALGARVVGIGNLSVDEVQKRIASCFPSATNENPWYVLSTSPAFITRPEVLHALGIVPAPGTPAQFRLEDDQGGRFSLAIAPVPTPPVVNRTVTLSGLIPAAKSQPLFRQRPGEPFWFTYLPDSQTVYVSWRGYRGLGENARALFAFLDRNPATRIVIDMRQNGGGDFFEGRKHMVEPLKQRAALNRKGGLYVVVGRRTYSAAMVNAIDFRKETNATLVGEPIGERPNSYSENDEMTLQRSRLVVSYSTRYYKFLEEDVPAVLPDVRIDPTWPEWRDGRDPVMAWILRQGR
jgi:hypothetical protein